MFIGRILNVRSVKGEGQIAVRIQTMDVASHDTLIHVGEAEVRNAVEELANRIGELMKRELGEGEATLGGWER